MAETKEEVPALKLAKVYTFDGVDYGPGDAVKIADPVAFRQIAALVEIEARQVKAERERTARKKQAAAEKSGAGAALTNKEKDGTK